MSATKQLSRLSWLSSQSSLLVVLPSFSGPRATNCSFAALGHISSLVDLVPPRPCRILPRVSRSRSTYPTCAPCIGMIPLANDLWVACVAVFHMLRVFVCIHDLALVICTRFGLQLASANCPFRSRDKTFGPTTCKVGCSSMVGCCDLI